MGGVLALVIAIGAIAFFALSGGDDDGGTSNASSDFPVPAKAISDLDEAAEAAGCEVDEYDSEGRGHTSEDVEYKTNPPTSGNHDPTPAQDGVYPEPPDVEQSVHALEHGRVHPPVQAGHARSTVGQLETLADEEVRGTGGYHTLMFENQTNMTAAVAATSWTRSVTCPAMNDKVFDALRAFREKAIAGEWEGDIPEPVP